MVTPMKIPSSSLKTIIFDVIAVSRRLS
jgi:hypothetical protein